MGPVGRRVVNEIPRANTEQRQAADPAASAWVNANAGSGKTHVLVDRLIRLMLAGAPPSRILCLTFTKAAAAEMSTRLFGRLSGWIALDDARLVQHLDAIGVSDIDADLCLRARRLFTEALETPGGLKIQTIHAFCERLLQLFPVEAGVVPRFEVMDELASAEMLRAARRRVMADALAEPDGPAGRALAEVVRHVHADAFDTLMAAMIRERAAIAPYVEDEDAVARAEAALRLIFGLGQGEDEAAVMGSLPLDGAAYRRAIALLQRGTGKDQGRAAQLGDALTSGATLFDLRRFFLTGKDEPCALSTIVGKKDLREGEPFLAEFVAAEQRRLHEALGKLADLANLRATLALLTLTRSILAVFAEAKRRNGAYDFDDLIHMTRRLFAEKPDAQWVLYKLDGGIDHVLLDEAQDTSPAQWEILAALTEEFFAGAGRQGALRTLFVVGDRKQSIYSFQGADPDFFGTAEQDFQLRIEGGGGELRKIDFKVSFRSAPAVLEAVDAVFAKDAPARRGLIGKAGRDFLHQSTRGDGPGLVEVWPVVEPEDDDDDEPWQFPVDREPANSPRRRLARAIAAKVKGWIGKRQLTGSNRAVTPGDILILVRTRNSFFDAMVRELRQAGVPVAGADRLKLVDSLAVQDVLALARCCLLEADDYALACVLKSPLLTASFSEEQLFALAHDRGTVLLWHRLRGSTESHAQAAARQLDTWRAMASSLRPYEFFATVIAESRARSIARLGGEAADALDALLDQVIAYESEHPSSLQGFLSHIASGDIEIKRNMEQGAGEVRIMTVHGAKGLEAPIVILPDTVGMPDGRNGGPLQFIEVGESGHKLPLWRLPKSHESDAIATLKARLGDDRLAEYQRLLYVAMTRARDELYVAGYRGRNDPKDECWYRAIGAGLASLLRDTDEPDCRRMGADPRPWDAISAVAAAASSGTPPDWLGYMPPAPLAEPRRPAPSKLGEAGPGVAAAIDRGLIIHRALQLLPELPASEWPAMLRRLTVRAGQPEALAEELIGLVARPEIAALLGEDGISEVPVMTRQPDGSLQRGRIDRLILRADAVDIVDYKTDRQWPADAADISPGYLLQIAAYVEALKVIHPGQVVRASILWTSGPMLMPIPDMVLTGVSHHKVVWQP